MRDGWRVDLRHVTGAGLRRTRGHGSGRRLIGTDGNPIDVTAAGDGWLVGNGRAGRIALCTADTIDHLGDALGTDGSRHYSNGTVGLACGDGTVRWTALPGTGDQARSHLHELADGRDGGTYEWLARQALDRVAGRRIDRANAGLAVRMALNAGGAGFNASRRGRIWLGPVCVTLDWERAGGDCLTLLVTDRSGRNDIVLAWAAPDIDTDELPLYNTLRAEGTRPVDAKHTTQLIGHHAA
jgi:hypothetical protein